MHRAPRQAVAPPTPVRPWPAPSATDCPTMATCSCRALGRSSAWTKVH